MAIYAAGTRLTGGEHDDVTHARRVIDGIAQRLCGSGPVPGIAEIRTDGQSQLVAAFIRPPCALAVWVCVARVACLMINGIRHVNVLSVREIQFGVLPDAIRNLSAGRKNHRAG